MSEQIKPDNSKHKPYRRDFLKISRFLFESYFVAKLHGKSINEIDQNFDHATPLLLSFEYLKCLVEGCKEVSRQVGKILIPSTGIKNLDRETEEVIDKLETSIPQPTELLHGMSQLANNHEWVNEVSKNPVYCIQNLENPIIPRNMTKELISEPTEVSGINQLVIKNGSYKYRLTKPAQGSYLDFEPLIVNGDGLLALASTEDVTGQVTKNILTYVNLVNGEVLKIGIANKDIKAFPLAVDKGEGKPRIVIFDSKKKNELSILNLDSKEIKKLEIVPPDSEQSEIKGVGRVVTGNVLIDKNRLDILNVATEIDVLDKQTGKTRRNISINSIFSGDIYVYPHLVWLTDQYKKGIDYCIMGTIKGRIILGRIVDDKIVGYIPLIVDMYEQNYFSETTLKKPIPFDEREKYSEFVYDEKKEEIYIIGSDGLEIPNTRGYNFRLSVFQPSERQLASIGNEKVSATTQNKEIVLSEFDLTIGKRLFYEEKPPLKWEMESKISEVTKMVVDKKTAFVYMTGLGLYLKFSFTDKKDVTTYLKGVYDQALKPFLQKKYQNDQVAQIAFDIFLKDVLVCSDYNELLSTMEKHDIYIMPWIVAAQPNPLTTIIGGETDLNSEIDTSLVRKRNFDGGEKLQFFAQGIDVLTAFEIPATSMAIQTLRMIHQCKPESVVIWGHSGGANALNSMLKIIQEGWADDFLHDTKINGAIMFGRITIPKEIYESIATLLSLIQNPEIVKKVGNLIGLTVNHVNSRDIEKEVKNLSVVGVSDFMTGIDYERLSQKINGPVIDVKNQFDPEQPSPEMFKAAIKFLQENVTLATDKIAETARENKELSDYGKKIGIDMSSVIEWSDDQIKKMVKNIWDNIYQRIDKANFFPYPHTLNLKITDPKAEALWTFMQTEMIKANLSGGKSDIWDELIFAAHINLSPQIAEGVLKNTNNNH